MGKLKTKNGGFSSEFLREAVADAKIVRESALESAKMALEEAFTPQLQSMITNKLQQEIETSDIGAADNKEPSNSSSRTTTDDPEEGERVPAEEDEDSVPDTFGEGVEMDDDEDDEDEDVDLSEMEMDNDDSEDHMDDDEDSLDLESILRELEDESEMDDDYMDDDEDVDLSEMEMDDDDDDEDVDLSEMEMDDDDSEEDYMDDDEDVDLSEMEMDDDYMDDDEDDDNVVVEPEDSNDEMDDDEVDLSELFNSFRKDRKSHKKIVELKKSLKEHRRAIRIMRDKLNEINILNAKLLFCNKLFRNFNMDNTSKMRIVENFDRAKTVREIKLVYTTLAQNLKEERKIPKSIRRITEGASKVVKSTKPEKILNEGDFKVSRIQKLAGIKK